MKLSFVALCLFAGGSVAFPQVPGDERWDHRFGVPGSDDITLGMAAGGGNVYIGGYFTAAGSANANRIARWDGARWLPLAQGILGPVDQPYVWAIAVSGSNVYAGGSFTNAGGLATRNIARWNGMEWSTMGAGLPGIVAEILPAGSDVYAAGLVVVAPDTNSYAVARWDGANWHTVGRFDPGAFAVSFAVLVDGTDIYVGGTFANLDGLPVNNVAHWNGTNWDNMAGGLTGPGVRIESLIKYNGDVYAGGVFRQAGAVAATNLARWDGTQWSAVTTTQTNRIMDLAVRDGSLYVAGMFTQIGGIATRGIAQFNGSTWSPVGDGVEFFGIGVFNGGVYDLDFDENGTLHASGMFISAGTNAAANVARWDGERWVALGGAADNGLQRFTSSIRAIEVADGEVYAGGLMRNAGTLVANTIARWTGTNWLSLGGGLRGRSTVAVQAIRKHGNYVYAGGVQITNAGGSIPVTNIARWNGASWESVGGGVHSNISAMAVFQDNIYVGGSFTNAGGIAANRIARWNGSAWSSLGPGANSNVTALAASGNLLYVGGNFSTLNLGSFNRIAAFDGFGFLSLQGGLDNGTVSAIHVDGANVYVGGSFTSVSGVSALRIARWNGSAWFSLGMAPTNGVDAVVRAIAVRNGIVYVGGDFTNAAGRVVNSIARWDGTNWSSLGRGLDMHPGSPNVRALAFHGDDLYVGGVFNRAGNNPAHYFTRWMPPWTPRLDDVSITGVQQLEFEVPDVIGRRVRIESSLNLSIWEEETTLQGNFESETFRDPTQGPHRLYRAVAVP